MRIGSSTSIMIRANSKPLGLGFLLACFLGVSLSCSKGIFNDDINADSAFFDCGDFCKEHELNVFKYGKFHIEVDAIGQPPQIFYNVEPKMLAQGLELNRYITVSGFAQGASAFLKLDAQKEHNPTSFFADIIAIPVANKLNYLSPPLPLIRSKLKSDQSFSIMVQADLDYVFVLNPNGLYNRAPIFLSPGPLNKDTNLSFNVAKEKPKLMGRVSSSDTSLMANFQIPQIKAKITQGNRLVSSVESIKKNGTIVIELSDTFLAPPKDLPLTLIIEAQDPEIALPRVKIKLDKNILGTDINIGDIDLGQLYPPFPATLEIVGADQSVIAHATVFMRAKVGLGTSFIKKQVDSSGLTTFNQLYQGSYDIAVIPPFASPFAMKLIKNFNLETAPKNNIKIELPLRQYFHGTISDSNNNKVSGAQVELLRIGNIGDFATEDIFDDMLFKLTAITNIDGHICQRNFGFETSNQNQCSPLTLDEGRYLAHIIPAPGSKLAHHWLTFDFPKTNSLNINLDSPRVLVGKIFAPKREAVIKNAFITIYSAKNSFYGQAKVVASTITDTNGILRAFISEN